MKKLLSALVLSGFLFAPGVAPLVGEAHAQGVNQTTSNPGRTNYTRYNARPGRYYRGSRRYHRRHRRHHRRYR